MLHAELGLVVDDSPRLTASAADRVQSEADDARRSKAVEVLRKALRNRRKKDRKKAAKSRTAAAEPDAARWIAEPAARRGCPSARLVVRNNNNNSGEKCSLS